MWLRDRYSKSRLNWFENKRNMLACKVGWRKALDPMIICPNTCVLVTTHCPGYIAKPISTLIKLFDEDCTGNHHSDSLRLFKGDSCFKETTIFTTPSREFPGTVSAFPFPYKNSSFERSHIFLFLRYWLWKSNRCHGDEIPTQSPYSVVQSVTATDLLLHLWNTAWECLPIKLTY